MLVVKVEVWPLGDASYRKEVSRIGIANRTGYDAVADYDVVLLGDDEHAEPVQSGTVQGFQRSLGYLELTKLAVAALGHSREPSPKSVWEILELLNRGSN